MNIIIQSDYRFYQSLISEYQKLFLNNISKYLKINLFIQSDTLIKSYIYNYKLIIKNIQSIQILDYIQKYNYYLYIKIPIIIKNYINNIYNYNNFLYYILPIPHLNGMFILNGIKRILLPNFINYESFQFTTYNKCNKFIYILNIIFYKYNLICHIELDIYKYTIYLYIPSFKFKINFIYLLYFLNITNRCIVSLSTYGASKFLTNILIQSTDLYQYFKINKYIKLFYYLIKINFLSFKFIKNKYIQFNKEIIKILDIIIDFSLNKINNNDHFGNKKINISINNLLKFIHTHNIFVLKNLPQLVTNHKIFNNYYNIYKEFLILNPLFRIIEEINIISELSNLVKIINYNFITSSIYKRDFKINQIGKLCILNTTEGTSSGIILSHTLNTFYNINNYSSEYLTYKNTYLKLPIILNTINQEQKKIVLIEYSAKKLNNFNKFIIPIIWYSNISYTTISQQNILTSIKYLLGPSENLIPFIFFTDPTRCLMGAKMQTQSVPIIGSKKLLILTGFENYISYASEIVYSIQEGIVCYSSSYKIIIRDMLNREIVYYLNKYKTTNQSTIKYIYPVVWVGERVTSGQILACNNMIKNDEVVLGSCIKTLYGSYFGYDYEDSLIISQQLLYNNIFTSVHIYVYETNYKYNSLECEYSSLLIPNIGAYFKRNLDIYGIIKEGSYILNEDVIISKLLKKRIYYNNTHILNNLIYLLFGNIIYNINNISIRVFNNTYGRVLKIELFIKDYLNIRIFIGNINLLKMGDKLCGRHGNKGIISYISRNTDLPYMQHGEFPDIITGTLGIPSRMNIGQLYEGLFGIKSFYLDTRLFINTSINNTVGINYLKYLLYEMLQKVSVLTSYNNIYNEYDPGRVTLRDGRSGDKIKGSMCFGILHYFKLIHMIKDKNQCRTVGSYTNMTQQPVKGKNKGGGQRFGEMEVWSLEAFGSIYTLKELLSSRSDDIHSRKSLCNMISKGKEFISENYLSEPFKIIIKELQGLALNINMSILYPNIYYKMKKILVK